MKSKLRAAIFVVMLSIFVSVAQGDVVDRDWTFDTEGNLKGWSPSVQFTSSGVVAGYWWGESSATGSYILGPAGMGLNALPNHHISIKMRLRNSSSTNAYYGSQICSIRWLTNTCTEWADAEGVTFVAYGNGAWHEFNLPVGHLLWWTGTITQLRFEPCADKTGKRVEIAWIRIMRDTTPPEFTIKTSLGYDDNERTPDTTPTLVLRKCFDNTFDLVKAEFYKRPHGDGEWTLAGTDSDPTNGFAYTYAYLAPGAYDLAVRVYDKAGNAFACGDGADHWINNLIIDPSAPTVVRVRSSKTISPFNKLVTGMNIDSWQWCGFYNSATNSIPPQIEARAKEIKMGVLRYPFGCHADTFYWKQTIGPLSSRGTWYINDCGGGWLGPIPFQTIFGVDECCRWCEKMGIEPQFVVRFRWPGCPPCPVYDDPVDPYTQALQDAADWVEYCNSPNDGSNPNGGIDWAAVRAANGHPAPYNVKYWEIGNEPWANDPYGSPPNAETYCLAAIAYANAMKAVDPTIIVSAGAMISPKMLTTTWDETVYPLLAAHVGAFHPHPTAPKSNDTNLESLYWEVMSTSKHLEDCLDLRRRLIRQWSDGRYGDVKLLMSEWEIRTTDTTYPRDVLCTAGLATADYLRVYAENNDVLGSSEYSIFYPGLSDEIVKNSAGDVSTAYYPFYMVANRCFDEVVETHVDGSPRFDYVNSGTGKCPSQTDLPLITAFATKAADGRVLSLTVINKDKTNSRTATIDFSEFVPAGVGLEVDIWELNAAGISDNTPIITQRSALYPANFTYDLPAHSVTSFIVRPAVQDKACISEAKEAADSTRIRLTGKIVTAVFGKNVFYVEEADRSAGIMVVSDEPVQWEIGSIVTITGTLGISPEGERRILADSVIGS